MRKLLVILFVLLFLLGLALAQQTQLVKEDDESKIPVEFYYNAGNKQSQEIAKQLVELDKKLSNMEDKIDSQLDQVRLLILFLIVWTIGIYIETILDKKFSDKEEK